MEYMPEEDEYIEKRQRGKPTHNYLFKSNIVENLNNLLGNLRLQEAEIKQRELDVDLKRSELKKVRKMQRDISRIYLNAT